MKKVGSPYTKNGINYLLVDNKLIRKFKFKDTDAYYEHKGVTYSLGASNNTVDVSCVTYMGHFFANKQLFDGDISNWDVSSVTDMGAMFANTPSFNGDISNWDVSGVTDMSWMFQNAHSFNGNISNWDVSSVTDVGWMFYLAKSFNGNISNWDVSSVTDMQNTFNGRVITNIKNHNIPKWYTDKHGIALTPAITAKILTRLKRYPALDEKNTRAALTAVSLGLNNFWIGEDCIFFDL